MWLWVGYPGIAAAHAWIWNIRAPARLVKRLSSLLLKIPLSLSLPVSRYLTLSVPSSSAIPSRTRSRARGRARGGSGGSGPALRTTRSQGTARAAVPPSLGRPRGRGRPGRGRGRLELGGSRADQDQPLPDSLSELLALVRSEVQLAQQPSTGAPALNPSSGTDVDNQLVATSGQQWWCKLADNVNTLVVWFGWYCGV